MTDTTDQQAVTVAQIPEGMKPWTGGQFPPSDWAGKDSDILLRNGYRVKGGYRWTHCNPANPAGTVGTDIIAYTPTRLASVSSASAEGFVLVPREPTEAMLEAGIYSDFWGGSTLITRAVRGVWSAMLAASPEPVPATNQAGEAFAVDAKIEYPAFTSWWSRTIPAVPVPNSASHHFDAWMASARYRAALATQPATSQEGCYQAKFRDMIAATPTPPTLSEDLREALRDSLAAELDGSYDCGRVWSAWSYGTMGEDDFSPITDRVDEIASGIIAALNAALARAQGQAS